METVITHNEPSYLKQIDTVININTLLSEIADQHFADIF